jgi:hypothetical protein
VSVGDLLGDLANESPLHDGRLLLPLSKPSCLSVIDVDAIIFLTITVKDGYPPVMMLASAVLGQRRFVSSSSTAILS